ncbi:50S ribosomal protein L10 [Anthocerotibacter panamensis]|uniref:50S ribosomal protein L10 n=1 Tax=Anthocerotibacter panamensis TaxID=2857077 RepID=UPI001C407AC8|nr:50S ribosomal protein L10 [Anthocerotibacter panamensis]
MPKRTATKKQGRAAKEVTVADIQKTLERTNMLLVIDYRGLTVAEITNLRNKLRPLDASCLVAKNTLMRRAVAGTAWEPSVSLLKGPSAVLFGCGNMKEMLSAYEAFQKESKKTELRGGAVEGAALTLEQIKAVVELPSKEQLFARAAGAIQAIPTKVALGIKQVPTKVALAVNESHTQAFRAIGALKSKLEKDSQPTDEAA